MDDSANRTADAHRSRRRRRWILALAFPGYVACLVFALMAWSQNARFDPGEWALILVVPLAVTSLLCFLFFPLLFLVNLWLVFRDPWRHQRSRRERLGLRLLVFGSLVAWVTSVRISDLYHLWR